MIGEALYDLLSTNTAIVDLVEDRVSPVAFREAETFPGINYNTQGITKGGLCRGQSANTWTGLLEIGMLASNTVELETLSDTITQELDNYDGIHAGYRLSIDASNAEFDEKVEDFSAYYKALQFDFTATKL